MLAQQGRSFADAMSALHGRAIDYRDLLVSSSSTASKEEVANTDVINLQLTSGTTGQPKAVALTSRNFAEQWDRHWGQLEIHRDGQALQHPSHVP